ncbi:MAG TPA: TIGR03067 domain-containing protein [Gemmataceae bacterium]|nr:TIGR03067 domain-containing protein [Gemmataceae bacterium]
MGAPALKDKPAPSDLYGEWDVEAIERDGKVTPVTSYPVRYRFNRDGTYQCFRAGRELGGPRGFTFDPKTSPPAFDFSTPPADASSPHLLGVYHLDGDRLAICIAGPKVPRPTEMAAPPGADVHIARFRRVKPKG